MVVIGIDESNDLKLCPREIVNAYTNYINRPNPEGKLTYLSPEPAFDVKAIISSQGKSQLYVEISDNEYGKLLRNSLDEGEELEARPVWRGVIEDDRLENLSVVTFVMKMKEIEQCD